MMQAVTEEERCVCHFFHQDFERCRILDKHLAILSKKYFDTRFIKLSAPVSLWNQTWNMQLAEGCQSLSTLDIFIANDVLMLLMTHSAE